MSSLNRVTLIGRLGKDPEVKDITSGKVATVSVATSEQWESNGKQNEKTEWHRVVFYGKLAGVVEKYLQKGALVCVEGKISTRTWTDKAGGEKSITEIIAKELTMLSKVQQKPEEVRPSVFDGMPF